MQDIINHIKRPAACAKHWVEATHFFLTVRRPLISMTIDHILYNWPTLSSAMSSRLEQGQKFSFVSRWVCICWENFISAVWYFIRNSKSNNCCKTYKVDLCQRPPVAEHISSSYKTMSQAKRSSAAECSQLICFPSSVVYSTHTITQTKRCSRASAKCIHHYMHGKAIFNTAWENSRRWTNI